MFIRLLALAAGIAISGCTSYGPPKYDEQAGRYDIHASVEPQNIAKRETRVDLKKYRFAFVVVRTFHLPQRTEFLVRDALVRSGFQHVLNGRELTDLVTTTPQLSWVTNLNDPVTQRRLAETVGPIAGVWLSFAAPGADRGVRLVVSDIATGAILLDIHYDGFSMAPQDQLYPVFNELKKWADDCKATKENT